MWSGKVTRNCHQSKLPAPGAIGHIVGLVALAGIASIDLQYWNWWGFSARYTIGVAVNRLLGCLIAAFVLLNWVV
jgi:hypothetical protein